MEHDLFAASELAEGAHCSIDVLGQTILVARVGGACHAVSGICPHAGARLGEGVLHGCVIICPWHKAGFRIDTGVHVEPPAVDDLQHFPVTIVDGRVRVTIEAARGPGAPRLGGDPRCMVIAGAGAAGAVAAQTLRGAGFTGRVVMIGREDRLPYDRTLLSKYVLSGQQGGEKSPLQDAEFYNRNRIERQTAEIVTLDPASRVVSLADGSQLGYDAALIATGGAPRPLDVPGGGLPGVHVLRTPRDAAAIVATAGRGRRAVVIGSGYIGLEVAGSLRERGLDVAVVAPQRAPLERQLGPDIGGVFQVVHERQGVVFHMGEDVTALEGDGRVERVLLKSGRVVPADLVVAGLGIAPATGFLPPGALREDRGVDVDAQLRLADGLYAAGDIAAFPLYGAGERIRVEHWRVAEQHGRVAALNMLGGAVGYAAVPYFWTIHYMKRLDYVGHAERWDEVVIDGNLHEPNFVAYYVEAGLVKAVAGWGRDRAMAAVIPLMTERHDWSLAELQDALSQYFD